MKWPAIVYVFLIGLVSLHFYQKPEWNMDMIGYMGNALMTNHTPIEKARRCTHSHATTVEAHQRRNGTGYACHHECGTCPCCSAYCGCSAYLPAKRHLVS